MGLDGDPYRPDRVVAELNEPLRTFNDAGVLSGADIHAATTLGRLVGGVAPEVVLAAAFAVRAPRFGHVYAQLDDLAETVTGEDGRVVDVDPDMWPADIEGWVAAVAESPLVDAPNGAVSPLHLDGSRLYLDRYWRYEHHVADIVRQRVTASSAAPTIALEDGNAVLQKMFASNPQQLAGARSALSARLSVIAGGPGTGKTATIVGIVTAATEHATRSAGPPVRVAVAAPTGKAAARLGEAMRQSPHLEGHDLDITPTTLHRLLGWTRNRTRFRHHATNPLPYDLIVVDEMSMVPLSMLSRLLDATPAEAHLVLVGDPDQLAAVEAGTVLGDLVAAAGGWDLADHVVTLRRGYRFDSVLGDFARCVREGDVDGALAQLTVDPGDLTGCRLGLVRPDRPGQWPSGEGALAGVRQLMTASARDSVAAAAAGDAAGALAATLRTKILCAHRRGSEGVAVWNAAVEGWVHDLPAYHRPLWYPGRPVMVTANDYELGVYNGDIGVVVRDADGHLRVAIDGRPGRPIEHRRLEEVQTVHAMTVHKSQGSQFDRVVVVLPTEQSPVLTRQLLYTAVTRARRAVTVVGTPEALADAIHRSVARASALPERLRYASSTA